MQFFPHSDDSIRHALELYLHRQGTKGFTAALQAANYIVFYTAGQERSFKGL